MSDSHDKILNAFLSEMLGEERPGMDARDVVRNVQARIEQGTADAGGMPAGVPDHPLPDQVAPTRVVTPASHLPSADVADESVRKSVWLAVVGLAAMILVTTGVVVWSVWPEGNAEPIAENPADAVAEDSMPAPRVFDPGDRRPMDRGTNRPDIVPDQPRENEPALAQRPDIPADQTALVDPPKFVRKVSWTATPATAGDSAERVDDLLAESWEKSRLQPVADLGPATWATRLMTRVLGRTPTAGESQEIEQIVARGGSAEQIRDALVDWMMADDAFGQEFSQYWGRSLAWVLLGLGPSLDTTDADMLRIRDWLSEQIAAGESLDEAIYELVSAVGSTDPQRDDFDPAASYLIGLNKRFGSRELATVHLTDVLLNESTHCARCHDPLVNEGDPRLAENGQDDFYELHSFFAQTRIEKVGDSEYRVVNRNYLPLGQQGEVEAPFTYTDLAGAEHEAWPRWNDLEPGKNGFVAIVDRRSLLAAELVASTEFRNAMVDHVWASLLNVPLSGIDDSAGTAAAEQLQIRAELAEQWAANGFQLSWLVKAIVLTDAFAVGVGTEEQLASNNPFLGSPPRFNQFYQRLENRRSAAGSLTIVARAYEDRDSTAARSAGLLARVDGPDVPPPTVLKAWLPTNDNQWATSAAVTRQLDWIANSEMTAAQKIEHLVLAALGRKASSEEVQLGQQILAAADDPRLALQDIWWGLLNSVEHQLPYDVW